MGAAGCTGKTLYVARFVLVVGALAAWFYTQHLIGAREFPKDRIGDGLLALTAPLHQWLLDHPGGADALLIASSAIIDLLGIFLLGRAIFGPSIRPLLGLLIIFGLRQICQSLCALPPPEEMIWRYPGFPSLLVTYGVSNDLFFSGHTALATYGAVELGRVGKPWIVGLAIVLGLFEVAAVMVLRAHYTMDVFAALFVALFVGLHLDRPAAACDRWIARLCGRGAAA